MSDTTNTFKVVKFPEGSIAICDNGTMHFRFRDMEYISARGRDSTEFMGITLDKETADAIKHFFRRVLND